MDTRFKRSKSSINTIGPYSNSLIAVENEQEQPTSFCIPYEIILLIFSNCEVKTLASLSATCKQWHTLSEDNAIWIKIAKKLNVAHQVTSEHIKVKYQLKSLIEKKTTPPQELEDLAMEEELCNFASSCISALL